MTRLFWLEFRPCFVEVTFKNRGHLGSRYTYPIHPARNEIPQNLPNSTKNEGEESSMNPNGNSLHPIFVDPGFLGFACL